MMKLRQREPRKSVRIGARIRTEDGWFDATIANVSSRGMMLRSAQPLRRNQFVEVTRGHCVVVGRIVWNHDDISGLQTQDSLDLSALLAKPTERPAMRSEERRAVARPDDRAWLVTQRSQAARLMGRAIESTVLVVAIATTGILGVSTVLEAADAPIEQVRLALGGSAPT